MERHQPRSATRSKQRRGVIVRTQAEYREKQEDNAFRRSAAVGAVGHVPGHGHSGEVAPLAAQAARGIRPKGSGHGLTARPKGLRGYMCYGY